MLFGNPLSNYKPRYLQDFSHRKRVKSSYTAKEAQILAPQYLKQVQESTRLVNTTIKPDIFFKRYDLMISCLAELKKMQKVIKFSGKKPSVYLDEVISTREKQIELFVERIFNFYRSKILQAKTTKSKITNYNKFIETMQQISCEFSTVLISKVQMMSEELRRMCN